jgi:soluble lytic murein transglycosylase
LSLATSALADGDEKRAAEAYLRLYYEFPLSEHAAQAEGPLQTLSEVQPVSAGNARYKLELGRGERLFGAKRYGEARDSFARLKPFASDDDAELVALRLAEVDYFQKRYLNAREALRPFLTTGARQAEARFFYLMSQRGLRQEPSFEQLVRSLTVDFPTSTWAEEALNNLATHYLQQDLDAEADVVFREMFAKFPRGRYGERSAWKAGWASFRRGEMEEAVRYFESAAASFPRSDYRPAWLYWSGRARAGMNDRSGAMARLQLTIADYHNTYYGRLAEEQLKKLGVAPGASTLTFAQNAAQLNAEGSEYFPPTGEVIRTLLALGLYEPATSELEFARAKWGDSPGIAATIAWANKQMAVGETGTRQFNLARGSINLMKRAYPQFMAGGGEQLPRDILTTIYPLSYWDLIKKYSAQHNLDPYLIAALMAQESTFVRDIKSSAAAYGLMQLRPSTARPYARKLKLRYSLGLLTTPEPNIRIGTMYFADKVRQFGSVHLALASYNAGETPVRRWMREKGELPRDVFVDDIPYPETQQYVKRILGTAEDYRRLYGPGL